MLCSNSILVDYATFSRLIWFYSLRLLSWDRVQGRLVSMIDQIDIDSQLVTIDPFDSTIVTI